jgi:hypothetical protein
MNPYSTALPPSRASMDGHRVILYRYKAFPSRYRMTLYRFRRAMNASRQGAPRSSVPMDA